VWTPGICVVPGNVVVVFRREELERMLHEEIPEVLELVTWI
jgi:hypothetical protein